MTLHAAQHDLLQPHNLPTAFYASVGEPALRHTSHFTVCIAATTEQAVQEEVEHLACNACTRAVAEPQQQHAVVKFSDTDAKV